MADGRPRDFWRIVERNIATILSIFAILLSVYSAAATHHQERIAMLPRISFARYISGYSDLGLFVQNSGNGPAVIKTFELQDPGKKLDNWSGVFSEHPLTFTMSRGYFLRSADQIGLLTLGNAKVINSDAFSDLIRKHINVKIEYCSIYGDCWISCSADGNNGCETSNPSDKIFNPGFLDKFL